MAGTTTTSRRMKSVPLNEPGTATDILQEGSDLHQLFLQHQNVIDDLETLRGAGSDGVVAVTELMADHEVTNNLLDFQLADGVVGGSFTIAATADPTLLGAGFVVYRISGKLHYCALDTTITLEDHGDIIQNKFGAWRIEIDRTGAVTTNDTGAQMAWDSAEDALLNLAAVAPTASTVTLGYVTITDSGAGGFNIGTTNTSGGTATTTVYTVRGPRKQVTGLTAALGAATAVGATPERYSTGTKDVVINGVKLAQIAAEADKTFDDADTIDQSKFGGWLLVTNLAQNATYSLAADGNAGAVSAMAYASSAAVDTALDTLTDNLPLVFCPVAKLVVTNNKAGVWAANTDDINGTDGTAAFTDATSGTWDRNATTGFDSHQINPPTVPATLTASAPSGTAINQASDLVAAKIGDPAGVAITS